MGERGLGRKGKGGNKNREIIGQYEVGGCQRGEEAPHLACALGPATWGSNPASLSLSQFFLLNNFSNSSSSKSFYSFALLCADIS